MIEIKIIIKAINNIKNSAKFIHWPLIIIFFIWNCLGFVFKSLNFFIIYSSSSIIMDLTSSAASCTFSAVSLASSVYSPF